MISDVRKELREIKSAIKQKYPDAVFRLTPSADRAPQTRWLHVYSDKADLEGISDLVTERELDLLFNKQFRLAVLPHSLKYLPSMSRQRMSRRKLYAKPRLKPVRSVQTAREKRGTYSAKSKTSRSKS